MATNTATRKSMNGLLNQTTSSENIDITQNLDMNSFKIVDLGTGTDATDAVNLSQIAGIATNTAKITIIENSCNIYEASINAFDLTSVEASLNFLELSGVQFSLAIANNTSNISTNTSNIATANSNISTNTSNIATNTSNIATNTSNIATNTSAISTANSNISTNTSNIATNTSAISTANTNITNNETAIDALVALTTTQTSNIATNASNITANTSAISTHTAEITALETSCNVYELAIGEIETSCNVYEISINALETAGGGSVWSEDGTDVYRESGNVGIGGGVSGRPSNRLDIQNGSLRVSGNMNSPYDIGFMAGVDGDILCHNANIIDTDTSCVKLKQTNSASSNTGFTELFIGQEYRNPSSSNSAVWAINVRSENGSFVGNQTNSAILCLMKDNGSIVVNSSRNNNGVRLRVHGTSAGSSGFAVISDDRIKYHEQDIKGALAILNKLKVQKYQKITESLNETGKWIPSDAEWDSVKNTYDSSGHRLFEYMEEIGFIAQEVRKINDISFCVSGEEVDEEGDETPLLVNYQDIFALSIQGIQELDAKRKEDNKKFIDLNKRLLILEEKLKNIESSSEKEYIL